MTNPLVWSCAVTLLACASCRGTAWVSHSDPLGFRVDAPAGWQVAGDRHSGRVTVSGPAGQVALIWPVFLPQRVETPMAPAILRRLAAAAGVNAAWAAAPAPAANVARMAGAAAGRTAVASFAWVESAGGTAGFLYIAAAPSASYAAETATLSRIFQSFRATGAAAGGSAAGQPAVKWVRWEDPRENAFSLDVPQGWAINGGAFRFAAVDIRKTVEAVSPGGAIRIAGGDRELPTFTEPNQMLAMTGFREGSWYSPGYGVNMLVRRYTPGAEFARQYVAARAAQGCGNLQFTAVRGRPDADAPVNQLLSGLAAGGGMMRIESGEARFTCQRNGAPVAGYYFAGSLRAGMAGMPGGIWHVEYLYGYLAAREQAPLAEQILSHMVASYRENPQWEAMQQNVTAATSRIVTETQQQMSKLISDSFAYQSRVGDEISRRRENATLGRVDVIDPVSGREFKVENSSNYFWIDNRGFIAGTRTDTTPGWDFRQMTALP